MSRDLQDIPPLPVSRCLLIGDQLNVLKGLVQCSGDVESGCLEPVEVDPNYKSYVLPVDTQYYSTRIRVLSFETFENYKAWSSRQSNDEVPPSAVFICIDVTMDEGYLRSFLQKLAKSDVSGIESRSLLLFGMIPYLGNEDHPKAALIQRFIEETYIETVKFNPNEGELEELEENRELYGIIRVWELIKIADWPTKILKKDVGRYSASQEPITPPPEVNVTKKIDDSPLAKIIPSVEDQNCIYKLLCPQGDRIFPMPENEDPKVPALSLKHLMRQREMARKGIQTSREQNNALDYVQPGGQLNYTHRLSTETTLLGRPEPEKTHMSIVNTTKQLEADKASAGSTSINVIAPLAPNEEVTLVQKKPKKKKGKKQTVESAVSLNVPLEPPESLEDAKEMKEEIERIFDRLQEERNIMEENKSFDELLENWNTVRDNPPNDDKVYVATQLATSYLGSDSSLSKHLAPEIAKKKAERKKDQ